MTATAASDRAELAVVPRDARPAALATMGIADVRVLAENVARSRLFKGFETPEAAFTLMMICQAEGIHPMLAMRRYDVIQGRPALKSDAMLADFAKGGGKIAWKRHDHECVEAVFEAPGLLEPLTVRWTIDDAKKAGLAGKDNWRNFTRQMLRARVVSEGVRMAMPGVVAGIYTPEEVSDFEAPSSVPPPATRPAPAEPKHDPATGEVLDAEAEEPRATPSQVRMLAIAMNGAGVAEDRTARLEWISEQVGRLVGSSKELTKAEASKLIAGLTPREPGQD